MAVFDDLNGLNINGHTEKKNVSGKELTYLSWPWAWAEVKKRYPDAHYTIWKNADGLPYTEDPLTGFMVYTSVTIDSITHEMWLPVMDGANRAMRRNEYDYKVKNPNFKYATWNEQKKGFYDRYGKEQPEFLIKHCDAATMMDINKAIMRCLVKNLAMFGLGLYIYAGEDLPEAEKEEASDNNKVPEANVRPQGNQVVQEQASVTTANKVPAPQPQAAGNVPQAAGNEPETPAAYIKRKIAELKEKDPDFNFVNARNAMIQGGIVQDVPSATMTMDQAKELIAAIAANCVKKAG